jgi:hypothetical protein
MQRRAAARRASEKWVGNASELWDTLLQTVHGSAPSKDFLRTLGIEPMPSASERKLQLIIERIFTLMSCAQPRASWFESPVAVALLTADEIEEARRFADKRPDSSDGVHDTFDVECTSDSDDACVVEVSWAMIEHEAPEGYIQSVLFPRRKAVTLLGGEELSVPAKVAEAAINRSVWLTLKNFGALSKVSFGREAVDAADAALLTAARLPKTSPAAREAHGADLDDAAALDAAADGAAIDSADADDEGDDDEGDDDDDGDEWWGTSSLEISWQHTDILNMKAASEDSAWLTVDLDALEKVLPDDVSQLSNTLISFLQQLVFSSTVGKSVRITAVYCKGAYSKVKPIAVGVQSKIALLDLLHQGKELHLRVLTQNDPLALAAPANQDARKLIISPPDSPEHDGDGYGTSKRRSTPKTGSAKKSRTRTAS